MKKVKLATVRLKNKPFWNDGLTIKKVADDLGMSYPALTNLRKGTDKGSWATLLNLSRYFKVPLEELIEVEEEEAD